MGARARHLGECDTSRRGGSDELSSLSGQWLEVISRVLLLAGGEHVRVTRHFPTKEIYIAAAVHSVPRPMNGASADFSRGLFEVADLPCGRCRYFGPEGFVGEAIGVDWTVMRALLLRPERLVLIHALPAVPLVPWLPADDLPPVCWGYGRTTARPPRSF